MAYRSPVQFAKIEATATGDNTVVDAVEGSRIKLVGYCLTAGGASSIQWKSGASTDISGVMPMATGVPIRDHSGSERLPLLQTAVGEALVLEAAAQDVLGYCSYVVESD